MINIFINAPSSGKILGYTIIVITLAALLSLVIYVIVSSAVRNKEGKTSPPKVRTKIFPEVLSRFNSKKITEGLKGYCNIRKLAENGWGLMDIDIGSSTIDLDFLNFESVLKKSPRDNSLDLGPVIICDEAIRQSESIKSYNTLDIYPI